jgi:hypothetical protein
MTDTTSLLATALENEAKLFLELVAALEHDDLYNFIRAVSELKVSPGPMDPVQAIHHVARNVSNIENAMENFYSV